ncbi:MAG TPA: prepilin peptidase [Tepidisphaeraceae bacterium]|jgi:leader peptidase (prepilin peptidase)/N-methyltransferase|nr:prepilin peptidase [Tepidisphaeraceae bacterium]
MPHLLYIPFLFALGACVGSFLNVVVYRLPRGISLVTPASRCPRCETPLAWYDNIPVFGWIFLRGKCRYCKQPISPEYPIVEAITGLLFVFYYVMFFMAHVGPEGTTNLADQWPIYGLYMALVAGLLAASLIDAELFIIPAGIPWWLAGIGIVVHGVVDRPGSAGALIDPPFALALCAGAGVGLIASIVLLLMKILPMSFPVGDLLEAERAELEQQAKEAAEKGRETPDIPEEFAPAQVRAEIRKEMLFLMPPLVLGAASVALHTHAPAVRHLWYAAAQIDWLNAGMGALLGGLIGGFVVWLTRILGSYAFGKEAMGLGDVHLMFGVGAVLGAGPATVTFFIAPFIGILAGVYLLIAHSRRQLPYGPYLSLAAGFVMLFYSPIAAYLQPGLQGLMWFIRQGLAAL